MRTGIALLAAGFTLLLVGCGGGARDFFTPNYSEAPRFYRYSDPDSAALLLEVYRPVRGRGPFPALVFFHGGGWKTGTRDHFRRQAVYFAARGMVTVLADYRVEERHGSSPLAAVRDAKSVMRYVRARADTWRIDPRRIAAAGGSAGGHLAAAAATISYYNNAYDDRRVSARPDALVLFNPVIDNSPTGYGHERIGEVWPTFSPLHNITARFPPTLFLVGTEDPLVPLSTAKAFRDSVVAHGGQCEVVRYEGQNHGFFNYERDPQHRYFRQTLEAMDEFLIEQGFLQGRPRVGAMRFDAIPERVIPREPPAD